MANYQIYKKQIGSLTYPVDDNAFIDAVEGDVTSLESQPVGETNTASNVGTGIGVFKQKVGVDFEYKTLLSGTNMDIVEDDNGITFNATGTFVTNEFTLRREFFTDVAGQSVFPFANTGNNFIVSINGVSLIAGTDYTTDNVDVTLAAPVRENNHIVEFLSFPEVTVSEYVDLSSDQVIGGQKTLVERLTFRKNFQQITTESNVQVLDFDIGASDVTNFRYARGTNSADVNSVWYVGDGSAAVAMQLNHRTGELLVLTDNGTVERFKTTASGVAVTGTLTISGGPNIKMVGGNSFVSSGPTVDGNAFWNHDFSDVVTTGSVLRRYDRFTNTTGRVDTAWYRGDGTNVLTMSFDHKAGILHVTGGVTSLGVIEAPRILLSEPPTTGANIGNRDYNDDRYINKDQAILPDAIGQTQTLHSMDSVDSGDVIDGTNIRRIYLKPTGGYSIGTDAMPGKWRFLGDNMPANHAGSFVRVA